MSIKGSKTGQSGASDRMGLILQPFFAKYRVNQPSSAHDRRPTAGPDTKSRKQPHAQ
jgi:hypothetical protein